MRISEKILAWWLGAMCTGLSCCFSFFLIWQHFLTFTNPDAQSKIIGIIWLVPIYSVDSWFGLRFKNAAIYLNLARDCYEGYALFLFLALMIELIGRGDEERVVQILNCGLVIKYPFPVSKIWREYKLPLDGREFLKWAKFWTLQYCVVKPSCAFLSVFLYLLGLYEEGSFDPRQGWIWLTVIESISVSLAFYSLVTFYMVLYEPLQPFEPLSKFLCIKGVLFVSFWQSLVLAILSYYGVFHARGGWTSKNVSVGIQDMLLCVEMTVLSLVHFYAFTTKPYKEGNIVPRSGNFLDDHFSHDSAVRDFNEVMPFLLPSWFTPGPAQSVTRQPNFEDEVNKTTQAYWVNGEGEEVEHLRTTLLPGTDEVTIN
eukprot:439319_1